ncbi:sigma-70 factor domain-containing protein [Streptomyces chartreusis]|uniref:RNA polymerase sigma-70 region 1.2 domain-containing protein n=1 Tax=Streptomyces chartreusis TaxID=1969 RepID=A0A7H8TGB8_STRCX|nr:sigma-70 factor domain-containing protein [Streptomyces chartreusis]QKZ21050.1 hypothetical protein HUT05_29105 [Streptomyces chartreusis]
MKGAFIGDPAGLLLVHDDESEAPNLQLSPDRGTGTTHPVKVYLRLIPKIQLLTDEQEKELGRRAGQRGPR